MDETQYPMKIFDSEFMMDISYQPLMPSFEIKSEPYVPETVHGPYLQIIEEPKQRGFRFRYECEGPSHGGLPGASSERNRRTYPTVKVCNYVGHARVEVQLVTHIDPPRVHAHSLVGKQCNENGTCSIDVGPNDLTAQFSNLGILHVTKRGVVDVLTRRLREEKRRLKEPGYHFSDTEEQAILREAKDLGKNMDLNIVRLKFTAYLQDSNGGFTRALKPVVSNPIYDSKSPNASNLKISRMDKTCGTVMGGDEIFLLCDKVQKDDIDIRFYEEEEEGGWEAFGDFSPTDVHKQYAIVFKTPPYHKTEIERPVTVFLQLKRKKGGDCSEPKQFTYIPQILDKEEVQRKRMKPLPHPYDHWRGPQGGAGGLGRGTGGFGGPGAGAGGGGMGGGFLFNNQLDGTGYYTGGCGGFGGGAQMSGSSPQSSKAQEQPAGSPEQQRLLQIDKEEVQRKRMKPLPHPYDHWRGLQGGAGGLGRGTGGFGGPGAGAGGGGMGGGFLFNNQLDGTGYYTGGCGGFGGGAQMSGSSPQSSKAQEQPAGSPEQQRLLQIATVLQNRTTVAAKHSARVLLEYCSTGDVRLLLAMQRQLCGVQDENGDTPLHLAIIHQQPAVALQLIQTIVNTPQSKVINKLNKLSQAPLHLAVITKQPKLVEVLLKVGADPSLLDRDGRTAVHLAAYTGDDSILRVLLGLLGERHAHLINTADFLGLYPLHLAIRKGGERCSRVLVEAGAKINMPEQKSGCTALHLAVKDNLFKVACTLITELKADVNACTFGGNSPLHLAASLGSPPLCSMLIAAGADKRLENDEPLFCSSSSSDEEELGERRDNEEKGPIQKDMIEQVQEMTISSERCRVNPRKRPAAGHTPFDLANCQKVKDLLDGRMSPKPSHHLTKKTKKSTEDVGQSLDDEMVSKLCGILTQSQVPWRDLAEKLGMLTLADLYQRSSSPCQKLLENYKISGGPLEGLVDALQSLGLSEGVQLLRASQPREDKQSTDATVDSGFGSQEAESPAIANH
ncbi:nuclear factor NF-kappa-B p100 subunit isoform X2 [Pygocentrus nattereri]|nr:nuclear factor NF-kappa-B p100 subunit isoform X2 [Pygocentrus nattereri]